MDLLLFQIDAFTRQAFKGNPAAVVPLEAWLSDELMQSIAAENNLSETAFFVKDSHGRYCIRWFSPLKEIAFCGHATLASAYVLFTHYGAGTSLTFWAEAVGELEVIKNPDGSMAMSFPSRAPLPIPPGEVPPALLAGLPFPPVEVLHNEQAYIAVYEDEDVVRKLLPDFDTLAELGPLDVAVTAPGREQDFVSRYFWPANGGNEDPVTGSIHAGLAPYWSARLGKFTLTALQASARSGLLMCRVTEERVFVSGFCVQYLEGSIEV